MCVYVCVCVCRDAFQRLCVDVVAVLNDGSADSYPSLVLAMLHLLSQRYTREGYAAVVGAGIYPALFSCLSRLERGEFPQRATGRAASCAFLPHGTHGRPSHSRCVFKCCIFGCRLSFRLLPWWCVCASEGSMSRYHYLSTPSHSHPHSPSHSLTLLDFILHFVSEPRAAKTESAPSTRGVGGSSAAKASSDEASSQSVSVQTSVWALLDLLASSWLSFEGKTAASNTSSHSDGGLGPVYTILFAQLRDVAKQIILVRAEQLVRVDCSCGGALAVHQVTTSSTRSGLTC